MMTSNSNPQFQEAETIFKRLNVELAENIKETYFYDPKDFRLAKVIQKSLIEVLEVLGEKVDQIERNDGEDLRVSLQSQNPAYNALLTQQKLVDSIIEEVVTFQHGGLNNSVDTMSAVVKEYTRGQEEISALRKALVETKYVLTAKKSGQIAMRDLWLKKKELEESLRILSDIDWLKESPLRIQRFIQQKRYFNAVKRLNEALNRMFSEDLVEVTALSGIREDLLELKGRILEDIVHELRDDIVGMNSSTTLTADLPTEHDSDNESQEEASDNRSEKNNNRLESSSVISESLKSESLHGRSTIVSSSRNTSTLISKFGAIKELSTSEELLNGLLSLDEGLELSIPDLLSVGSIYIRFLVRAVGLLKCEDDVERLVLESVSSQFQNNMRRIRLWAFSKLRAKVSSRQESVESESLQDLITEQFAEYISTLLESALAMLKKLLYLLKLLDLSKYMTAHGLILTSSSSHASIESWKYTIQDNNRKAILSLWIEIEEMITTEMKIHFIEKDVENISDQKSRIESPRYIDPAYSKDSLDREGDEDHELETDDTGPIFPPSVKLSASVYRYVLSYSESMQSIMKEEGVNQAVLSKPTSAASLGTTTNQFQTQGKKPQTKSLTVMEAFQATNSTAQIPCLVLDSIQNVLEKEFIPVVQGSVNQGMRDLQLNSQQYFTPASAQLLEDKATNDDQFSFSSSSSSSSSLATVSLSNTSKSNSSANVALGTLTACLASQLCLRAAKPLFAYWLQLPQHSDMVVTILDRLVRGFIACAREEMEAVSWKLLSADEAYRKSVISTLRNGHDSCFNYYRRCCYGGKQSVDDIVASFSRGSFSIVSADAGKGIKGLEVPSSSGPLNSLKEWNAAAWNVLWDIGAAPYGVSVEKIARDYSGISTIAAIANGCDWLVANLARLCSLAIRKLSNMSSTSSVNTSFNPRNSTSIALSAPKVSRFEFTEMLGPLVSSFQGYASELSRLAEEAYGILRTEIQIATFYFLHQLAHMKFLSSTTSMNSSRNTSVSDIISVPSSDDLMGSNGGNATGAATSISPGQGVIESNIIVTLTQHLIKFQDAIQVAISPRAVAFILSPLATLIPKILLKCVSSLFQANATFKLSVTSGHGNDSNQVLSASQQENKTRLLKAVVISQQSLGMIFEATRIDNREYKFLQDFSSEAFEYVRRYVSLMDLSSSELKNFMTTNSTFYSKEEYKSIWKYIHDRTNDPKQISFDEFYNKIVTKT